MGVDVFAVRGNRKVSVDVFGLRVAEEYPIMHAGGAETLNSSKGGTA
jgi:hypothetical protein